MINKTKICTNCNDEKELNCFGIKNRKLRNGSNKIYYNIYCKKCLSEKSKQYRKDNPDKIKKYNDLRPKKILSLKSEEHKKEKKRIRERKYYYKNKEQKAVRKKENRIKNLELFLINRDKSKDIFLSQEYLSATIKRCALCKIDKSANDFYIKKKKYKEGYLVEYLVCYCKECEKLKNKKWRENNKDYMNKYSKQNKEKIIELSKQPHRIENKNKYRKNKRKNDPVFRMRENVSNAILKALRRGKSKKAGQSILKHLRYSIQDLKKHIENQFIDGMCWENYGEFWHIDHIVPQSDLPYDSMEHDNFKKCWSLNNLRPYDAKQNIIDGATRVRHK